MNKMIQMNHQTDNLTVILDAKGVNEGLTAACVDIPPMINETIGIIKNGDEGERAYVTTACSYCQKRHIRCDDQRPSCQNCQEKGHDCVRIQPKVSRGRPQGRLNGQGKSIKKITNNGVKKTRKPRKKSLIKSNDVKFNDIIKGLLNNEGVGIDGNNNNDPSTLGFYNGLTPSSSFQSTLSTPSYSFTSSHDTYDINNNNTVIGSSNLTDSPIQAPFSFFGTSDRYNAHQLQFPIPPENISDFVLGPNVLTTNFDLEIVNDNYGGEMDPIQYHYRLVNGLLDTFNSSTPMNEQYVNYLKTEPILSINGGNYQLDAPPTDNCSFNKPHEKRGRKPGSKNEPKMNETENSNSNNVNVVDNTVNDTY
ncbi:12638_t:CDS:2 [Entrophospora sp. SA101]|nr:9055_t:CDS:2 [Entrophospora sp. SA101]CAJ0755138.1 12638_t:CDS:2 [Entrophospora sp. SA101]